MKYTLSLGSWSEVSVRIGTASYKWLVMWVQLSAPFLFMSFYECIAMKEAPAVRRRSWCLSDYKFYTLQA